MPTGEQQKGSELLWIANGKIVKIGDISSISFEGDDGDSDTNSLPNITSGTLSFELKYPNPTRKNIRMFRECLLIDLLPIKFPKKKNRRKKRLNRRFKKWFEENFK